MKNRSLLLTVTILCAVMMSHCDRKDRAWGTTNRIITVADSLDWIDLESTVRSTLAKEIFTPQTEELLELKKINFSELGTFDRYHNILILGTLRSGSGMKELFEARLSARDRSLVESDSLYLFKSIDPWYTPQLLVMMVARDIDTLKRRIRDNSVFLYSLFEDNVNQVISNQLYYRYEQKDIERQLLDKYGWTIRVPHEYFIAEEREQDNAVWFRRLSPERWLLVRWLESDDPSLLSEEWCLEQRRWIGEQVYSDDKIVEGYTTFNRIDFNGRYAFEVRGLWETEDEGGPFTMYAFYDESSSRIYVIDIACFSPGKEKMPFIRQLQVMAGTFRTKAELGAENE